MGSALVVRVVVWGCAIRRPTLVALVLVELLLVAGFAFISSHPDYYVKAFDLDHEYNFAAAYSALQLVWIAGVICSFLLVPGMIIKPLRPLAWAAAAGFAFLGFDEYAQVHERLSDLLVTSTWAPRLKENVGAWIPIYAACAAMLIFHFRHAIEIAARLHPQSSILFLFGISLLFLGSVGCEIIAFEVLPLNRADPLYNIAVAAEEFLEMSGASVILYAVLAFGASVQPLQSMPGRHNCANMALKA